MGHELDFCFKREDDMVAGGDGLPCFKISILAGFSSPPMTPPSTGRSFSGRRLIFSSDGNRSPATSPQGLGFNTYSTMPSPSARPRAAAPTALLPNFVISPPPGFHFSPRSFDPSVRSVHFSDLFPHSSPNLGREFYQSRSPLCPRDLSASLEQLAMGGEQEALPREESHHGHGGPKEKEVADDSYDNEDPDVSLEFSELGGWNGSEGLISTNPLPTDGSSFLDLNLGGQPAHKRSRSVFDQAFSSPPTRQSPQTSLRSPKSVGTAAAKIKNKGKRNKQPKASKSISALGSQEDPGAPEAAVVRPKPPREP